MGRNPSLGRSRNITSFCSDASGNVEQLEDLCAYSAYFMKKEKWFSEIAGGKSLNDYLQVIGVLRDVAICEYGEGSSKISKCIEG